jgi:hemoglobin
MKTVYEAAGGRDGLLKLAGAWHARVLADDVVSHAFSHGYHPEHIEHLAAYWTEALGGSPIYSQQYGDETSVVRMHSGNGEHEEMDRRAIACFDQAMVTTSSGRSSTTTSPGLLRRRCPVTTVPHTMCPTGCAFRTGPGVDS